MKDLNNPFVTYGYKGAAYFCDRDIETEKVMTGLYNERNITLIAPRRIGKTGLIHHVFTKIKTDQPEVRCFYIDIFATKTLEQFIQLLARNIVGKLDSPTQATLRKVSEFFSSFRPTMTFDPQTGIPTFSLDIVANQEEQSLRRIFEYLQQSGKRCYIAIDEFQRITEYTETNTEALLRSYIQFLPNVYFIFAGSQHHLMTDMFLSAKRPFYQSSQMVLLKEIEEPVYYQFAAHFFKATQTALSCEVFQRLYQQLEGQTWYLQATLNRLYSYHLKEISEENICQAIEELIDEQEVAFENYYASLTSNQCALLLAIAKEMGVKSPMARSFIQKYRLPALSSVKTALNALQERQLIYQYQGAYIVYDRFFSMWLRKRVAS
ncbi:MAG: ATP-binding protein [Bacteroidaceae bacterium]|nr:ATP-binding protein [Bacteroidaceae bacterium]